MAVTGTERSQRVTIRDVARVAGVSVGTVSKALNRPSGQSAVSSETRERVLSVCDKLRYRPNRSARSLRSGHSHMIGVSIHRVFAEETKQAERVESPWPRWDRDDLVPECLRQDRKSVV